MTRLADFRADVEIQFGIVGMPDKFEVKAFLSLKNATPLNITFPAGSFEGDDKGRFKADHRTSTASQTP